MRILIAGYGSIGRRHLANLRLIEPTSNIIVWHQSSDQSNNKREPYLADCVVYSLEDAIAKRPEIALITGPSSMHVGTGLALASHGIHLFVEKPIADTLSDVDKLIDLCTKRDLILTVGYNFHFYEPLRRVKLALDEGKIGRILSVLSYVGQYLPDWRPNTDYRKSVSSIKELGGGVLLELSHELDYLYWLIGDTKSVYSHLSKLSDLDINVEDTADIILRFANGAIGNIHLDMVQRTPIRNCRIIGVEGTITWDGISNEVKLYSINDGKWTVLYPACQLDRNEMYIQEIKHFIECVREHKHPKISPKEGKRILEMVLAARHSCKMNQMIEL